MANLQSQTYAEHVDLVKLMLTSQPVPMIDRDRRDSNYHQFTKLAMSTAAIVHE